MQAVLTALLLVALLVVSARVALAHDDLDWTDHDTFGAPDVIQTEPINLGSLWGSDRVPCWPPIDPLEDSHGQ